MPRRRTVRKITLPVEGLRPRRHPLRGPDHLLTLLRRPGRVVFMASLSLSGSRTFLAVREFFPRGTPATPAFSRRVTVCGLILAAVWHVEFLFDYRRVQTTTFIAMSGTADYRRFGYNPYLVVPNDPAVKSLHTAETRNLNNPNCPAPTHQERSYSSAR